jgi:hypothetical protein
MRAMETVNPSQNLSRLNNFSSDEVAPAITAVSNPKRKPPKAAVRVIKISLVFSFIGEIRFFDFVSSKCIEIMNISHPFILF